MCIEAIQKAPDTIPDLSSDSDVRTFPPTVQGTNYESKTAEMYFAGTYND